MPQDIEQPSENVDEPEKLAIIAKQALPHFYAIIRKVKTENLRLIDLRHELTQISLVFREIDEHCPSISDQPFYIGRGLLLSYLQLDEIPDHLKPIQLMVEFYNNLLMCFNRDATKLETVIANVKFKVFYICSDLETQLNNLPLTTSAPLHAFASLSRESLRQGFIRLKKTETSIDLVSYVLGYLSAEFFVGLAEKGAQLLPFEFMQNEELAVAAAYWLNIFLNGYFLKKFAITVKQAAEDKFVNLQKLFTNKTTPELDLLANLDPDRKATMLRGLEQAWTLFFSGTLAVGSTVVIGLIDWRELHDIKQLVISFAVYLALHYEGSITLQHALWLSVMLFGLAPRLYRDKFYTTEQMTEHNTLQAARAAHQNYRGILNSGFTNLSSDKTRFSREAMQSIYELLQKNTLEANAQLLFKIGQYADTPQESTTLHHIGGNAVFVVGQIAMLLSLLGYAAYSLQTVEGPDNSDGSTNHTNEWIALFTMISVTVFIAFYQLLGKDTLDDVYGVVGKPVQALGMLWNQTKTNSELMYEGILGTGKGIIRDAYLYPEKVRQRWHRSTGVADFIQQNSEWLDIIRHPITTFLGFESSAASLALNEESLNGLVNLIAKPPTIVMTMVANVFAVGPVLKDIALTIIRACTRAGEKKAEFVLRDTQESIMKIYNQIDPVIFLEILWSILQSIHQHIHDHEAANEHAERVFQALFLGQPVEKVFSKEYCDHYEAAYRVSRTPYVDTVTNMRSRLSSVGMFKHYEKRRAEYDFTAAQNSETTALLNG